MVGTNVIMALGVLYSIYKDEFKQVLGGKKSDPKLKYTSKKEYPVLDSSKTIPFHNQISGSTNLNDSLKTP